LPKKIIYYYIDNESKELYQIPAKYDAGSSFCLFAIEKYGLSLNTYGNYFIRDLKSKAQFNGIQTEVHKIAFFNRHKSMLYINCYNGSMYRLNGKIIELVDNGTDGVLFLKSNNEPFKYDKRIASGYEEQADLSAEHSLLFDVFNRYFEATGKPLEGNITAIYNNVKRICGEDNTRFMQPTTFRNKFNEQKSYLRIWFDFTEKNKNPDGLQPRYNFTIKLRSEEDVEVAEEERIDDEIGF
jgi:hypothetical protein